MILLPSNFINNFTRSLLVILLLTTATTTILLQIGTCDDEIIDVSSSLLSSSSELLLFPPQSLNSIEFDSLSHHHNDINNRRGASSTASTANGVDPNSFLSVKKMQETFISTAQQAVGASFFINQQASAMANSTCSLNDPCSSFEQVFAKMNLTMVTSLESIISQNKTINILFTITVNSNLKEIVGDLTLRLPSHPLIQYFLLFQSDNLYTINFTKQFVIENIDRMAWIIFYNLQIFGLKMVSKSQQIDYGFPNCYLNTIYVEHQFNGKPDTATEYFFVEGSIIRNSIFRLAGSNQIVFGDCTFVGKYSNGSFLDFKFSNQVSMVACNADHASLFLEIDQGNMLMMERSEFTYSEFIVATISVKKVQIRRTIVDHGALDTFIFALLFTETCQVANSTFSNSGGVFLVRGVKLAYMENVVLSGNQISATSQFSAIMSFIIAEQVVLNKVSITNNRGERESYALTIRDVLHAELLDCNLSNNSISALKLINEALVESTSYYLNITNTKFINNDCSVNGCAIYADTVFNLYLVGCYFENNRAEMAGGAISAQKLYRSFIRNCYFKDNYSNNYGGAIAILNSAIYPNEISNCIFIRNKGIKGGGIYSSEHCISGITNCIFEENNATFGGAIYSLTNDPKENNTFINNHALHSPNFMTLPDRIVVLSSTAEEPIQPGQPFTVKAIAYFMNETIPFPSFEKQSRIVGSIYIDISSEGDDNLVFTPYLIDSVLNDSSIITLTSFGFHLGTMLLVNCSDGFEMKPYALPSVANIYSCQPVSRLSFILVMAIVIPVSVIVFFLGILITILVMKGIVHIKKRLSILREKEKAEKSVEKRIIDKKIVFGDSYQPLIESEEKPVYENSHEMTGRFIIPISDITIEKKIAQGGQGVVYSGYWKNTQVAIKALKSESSEGFESEVSLLASLRHPCILILYGFSMTVDTKYMITEFLEGGSLENLIYNCKIQKKNISFLEKIEMLKDIANGMSYLHTLNPPIIHRDLKPGNVLLDKNNRCKIGDFGLSLPLSHNNSTMTKNIGTFLYMAPETISSDSYVDKPTSHTKSHHSDKSQRAKVDVYSFAIIMYELFFEVSPYSRSEKVKVSNEQSIVDILSKVIRGERPGIPFESETELDEWLLVYPVHGGKSRQGTIKSILGYCEMMRKCWDTNPMERLSFNEILEVLNEISNNFQSI